MIWNTLSSICITVISLLVTCQSLITNTENILQRDKLSDYNRNVIPKLDKDSPILVKASMYPTNIIRFNEQEELLYINAFLRVSWNDRNLAWAPENYNNITYTIYKQGQIWLPDFALGNAKGDMQQIGYDDLNVVVSASGDVYWEPGLSSETICALDTTYFPFDNQVCTVILSTWVHAPHMLRIISEGLSTNLTLYLENGQWEMEPASTRVVEHVRFSHLIFVINLKRRSAYYVTSLIVPVIAISILNCFGFVLPKESGEKISYSITTFLSYMVLLTLTMDNLPKTSKQTPIFVMYLACMLGLAFFSVLCSVITHILPTRPRMKDKELEDDTELRNSKVEETSYVFESGTHEDMLNRPCPFETNDNLNHSELTNDLIMQTRDSNVPNQENKGPVIVPLIYVEFNKETDVTDTSYISYIVTIVKQYIVKITFDIAMFVLVSCATFLITFVTFHILVSHPV